jgi:succinate dehydrogenase / fumarate reductase cytochrome b subunit
VSTAAPEIQDGSQSPERKKPTPYGKSPGTMHFWLRRIHSLMGILFGGYITIHLLVNFTGFWPMTFQKNVDKIHSLEPILPVVELVFIFIPLLVHVIYGIWIATAGVKFNTIRYHYGGNIRYFLQRFTGVILLAFLIYHVGTLHHWGFTLFGLQKVPDFTAENVAYQSTASAIKTPYESAAANFVVKTAYLLGVLAAVFHWANGLWTAAIAWGLTVTARAQKLWGHVCLAFGIFMLVIGVGAWIAFAVVGDPLYDYEKTKTYFEPHDPH